MAYDEKIIQKSDYGSFKLEVQRSLDQAIKDNKECYGYQNVPKIDTDEFKIESVQAAKAKEISYTVP